MATLTTLKNQLAKLEKSLNSKATPEKLKGNIRKKIEALQGEIKSKQPAKTRTKATANAKGLAAKYKEKYGTKYPKSNSIERDAARPALPAGKRVSKDGNVYYENRENRIDRKQPAKKYPMLEDGGIMEGGEEKHHEDVEMQEGYTEMAMSSIKEMEHHVKEIMQIVTPETPIEGWVIAKLERASTDLSDVTHYLDGRTYEYGGEVHRTSDETYKKGGEIEQYKYKVILIDKFGNTHNVAIFTGKGDALICISEMQSKAPDGYIYKLA